jgi:hypothetical protein
MANMSRALRATSASRARTALSSAVLTALALVGGLLLSFKVGSLAAVFLEGRVPRQYVIPLTTIAASTVMLSGSALWAIGMARLARVSATRRVVASGILGFVPITILVAFGLGALEPLVFGGSIPIHRLFTLLFVPSAGLIAGVGSLVLGWGLRQGRAALVLGLRVGLAAALAFLVINLAMEALGWVVGGPGAAERTTMLTVLFVGDTVAALASGAVLGLTLAQQQ